ncbi:MAG: hypothetical protein KDC02_16380 [Flavobacteriales bacterium]|nr:hypothetical protein [Flavobacteriales bacterium]
MNKTLGLLVAAFCAIPAVNATSGDRPPAKEVTFIDASHRAPDLLWQQELRDRPEWQSFKARNGAWYVEYNEASHTPHRAYGKPIPVAGATPEDRATNFLQTELSGFPLPVEGLELKAVQETSKYTYVRYGQRHAGLEVLFGQFMVKLDQQGRVVGFGADVYRDIDLGTTPAIGAGDAAAAAQAGLSGIVDTEVDSDLRVLPVPVYRGAEHHLVYQVTVHTQEAEQPGRYLCWVDANDGELLYRQNFVVNHAPPPVNAEVSLTGNVYEDNPYVPAVNRPMTHAEVIVNGQTFHTDEQGLVNTGIVGPVTGTFRLEGLWSSVRTGGVTPTFTLNLQDGANGVTWDNNANIRERSAYFHVNIVHDHVNFWLPSFTGMDFTLPTNVDVGGNCNAFYDGSSINFYAEGNDCQSYAQIAEVVYHEYGHGINDNYYQDNGSFFINGAMNEGYADIWALSITEDPVLAEGSSLSDPNDYIRRYDQDPKVYPQDLVGQVHADGEIICGAWWDYYVLLGNDMDAMMTLFSETFAGLQANSPNGSEGQVYRDVLIDALQADDNDGDITNGTPNGGLIVEAFALHGITLISNAELDHAPIEATVENQDLVISAELQLTFPFTNYVSQVVMSYAINDGATWTTVPMSNTGGNTWEATIPGQPQGTVVAYWMGVEDIFQQLSGVVPIGAAEDDPNLPFYTLVGYALQATEDGDNNSELGNFLLGLPTDNATTGEWTLTIPIGSFGTPGDPSTIVQTDEQHTPGGELCFVTGNASGPSAPLGENDVDGGTTTLLFDNIDLSGYVNPTITYWRWYVNNPPSGANPNADWWQVYLSDDNGQTWVPVEDTRTSDRSWRRKAFRVQDYVSIGGTVQMKFHASDSLRPGQNLDGGSLIEAALDDVQLWDNVGNVGIEELEQAITAVYPDPADQLLNVRLDLPEARTITVRVTDLGGREVLRKAWGNLSGEQLRTLNVGGLANGSYVLQLLWEGGRSEARFQVVR